MTYFNWKNLQVYLVYCISGRPWFQLNKNIYHHHHHHYHYRVLLLLVEHRASMQSFQALRSPVIPLTSLHVLPVFPISSSVFLRHVLFFYTLEDSNLMRFSLLFLLLYVVCPIQFHFLLFIWISIGFCLAILHSSSFIILSVHLKNRYEFHLLLICY
jgi:hypothetical protein